MGDVGISHNQAVVAHLGDSFGGSSPINGGTFADGGIISDSYQRLFPLKLQILRHSGNHCPRKNLAILADMRAFQYRHIRTDTRAFLNHYILVYRHERLDHHIVRNLRIGMDVC